jgi:hypothetical protein
MPLSLTTVELWRAVGGALCGGDTDVGAGSYVKTILRYMGGLVENEPPSPEEVVRHAGALKLQRLMGWFVGCRSPHCLGYLRAQARPELR